jgi:CheY-like chemotaxis protein
MLRRMPHLADVPALFVTGLTSEADIARYMEAGAIGVIPKPVMPMRLTGQLHSLWEQREGATL